jgi:uncharacterized protein YgiM (DUF1202 family)
MSRPGIFVCGVLRLASLATKQTYWESLVVRAKARTYLRSKSKCKARSKGEKQVLRFAKDDKVDGYAVAS